MTFRIAAADGLRLDPPEPANDPLPPRHAPALRAYLYLGAPLPALSHSIRRTGGGE